MQPTLTKTHKEDHICAESDEKQLKPASRNIINKKMSPAQMFGKRSNLHGVHNELLLKKKLSLITPAACKLC